ncbi:MAG: MFS transporter, partial [Gammaproteobacteria bacterium]|nr:MFS transporter [Gammaproteobacteria bacterium]NIR95312.1 MFS transporter [Gammaproteobacteria bacterium]NIT53441.1 MFS transporter [candidate division Zixibacteria bacterium]NIW50155.1 MFS transporter [Gammaproteobacteria bacterium]NIX59559.1 MFS transporter [candidate division Zixibacteria bacterium]
PAVMNSLVSATGWKNAWLYLAFVLGIGMTSIAFLIYRKNPESCGLHVDGIIPAKKEENEDAESLQDEIAGVTLNEALHTVSFWLLIAGLAVHAAIFTGFTFHIEAIGLQAGMSVRSAVAVFIPISFVTMPLSFLGSWASRKIHPVYYIYAHAGSQILAFISIFFLATPAGYIGTIIGIGISGGLMGPVMSAIIPLLY